MSDDIRSVLDAYRQLSAPREGIGGNPFRLASVVDEPATGDEMTTAWVVDGPAPAELVELWTTARSARLFEDVDYGQWGLALLPPSRARDLTVELFQERPEDMRPGDVAFGEFLGDQDVVIFARESDNGAAIRIVLPLDERDAWPVVATTVSEFLSRFLSESGQKYWE